jgi:hypothetical protein
VWFVAVARVEADVPVVEVRFKHFDVRSSVYLGDRALPTLINSYRNFIEVIMRPLGSW